MERLERPLSPLPWPVSRSLIDADLSVASVCVAFGAVLGKVSPLQMLLMTFFQVTLFSTNQYILLHQLEVSWAQHWDGVEGTERGGGNTRGVE